MTDNVHSDGKPERETSAANHVKIMEPFVLARDLEFSGAASLTFVSWNDSARGSL